MPQVQELRVRDRKTGNERTVTRRAYELLKKRYVLLEEIPNSKASAPSLKSEKNAPAAVVEARTPEQIKAKREELEAMNQVSIASVSPEEGIKVRQKPGPKTKKV